MRKQELSFQELEIILNYNPAQKKDMKQEKKLLKYVFKGDFISLLK